MSLKMHPSNIHTALPQHGIDPCSDKEKAQHRVIVIRVTNDVQEKKYGGTGMETECRSESWCTVHWWDKGTSTYSSSLVSLPPIVFSNMVKQLTRKHNNIEESSLLENLYGDTRPVDICMG